MEEASVQVAAAVAAVVVVVGAAWQGLLREYGYWAKMRKDPARRQVAVARYLPSQFGHD